MKRQVSMAILKIVGKAIFFTLLVGIAIVVFGYMRNWETSIAYSNAFFIAGCLIFAAGAFSRLGEGQEWRSFQLPDAESIRGMSSSDRANVIIKASSSASMVIPSILSGTMLILISAVVALLF